MPDQGHAAMTSSFGGADIDLALGSELVRRYGAGCARDVYARDMQRFKERHCYVATAECRAAPAEAVEFMMHDGRGPGPPGSFKRLQRFPP